MDKLNFTSRSNPIFDDLAEMAKAVTVTRNARPDAPPPYHGDEVIFDLGGKSVLGCVIRDDRMITLHGSTEPSHRGQGYALAVLQRAVKYAADNDLQFQTRDFVVPERVHVYKALAKRGYPVKVNFPAAPLEGLIEIDTRGIGLRTTDDLDGPEWTWAGRGAEWSVFERRTPQ